MTLESDRKLIEAQAALQEEQASKEAAQSDEDANCVFEDGSVKILGGKFIIPRVTARTLWLLSKINSPIASMKPGTAAHLTMDDLIETVYVIMNQSDPRILTTIRDRVTFDKVLFNMSGDIDLSDIKHIGMAIAGQISAINRVVGNGNLSDPNVVTQDVTAGSIPS